MLIQTVREDIVAIARQMHGERLVVGTAGNVSVRVPGEELVTITPSGFPYDEMHPMDWFFLLPLCSLFGIYLAPTTGFVMFPLFPIFA